MAAERRVTVDGPDGNPVEGVEVGVAESTERWSELTLEDGTVFRFKLSVAGAVRIPGIFDEDGDPIYALKTATIMSLVKAPEALRKPSK